MKRFSLLTMTMALFLLAANAFAQGAADKVTGTYTRAGCNGCQPGDVLNFISYRWLNAHEARGKRPQKGSMFTLNDAGNWFELDFTDTVNTCVKIYDDGRARIGGVVEYGNGPQVGRAFGFYLEDNGGPAYFSDKGYTVRFTTDYNLVGEARNNLQDWCETGDLLDPEELGTPEGYAVWHSIVIDGNFVVHNSPKDGD
ncbi:MAG: hypothetical protein KJO95_05910 [Gammaproteobacteria bacterium]|nr:hypothetical protein [Gammaproteobacteria bacterium]NNC57636.1 hypothetical protein [Woeseiaceae bacterium]